MAGESTTVAGIHFALGGHASQMDVPWRTLTMDLDELRSLTREKLQRGELPRDKCQVTWFGPGVGQPCALCGRTVTPLEIECECEQSTGATLRFHQPCFAVWDEERRPLH